MAVSGAATSAYRVWLEIDGGGTLRCVGTTSLSSLCTKPSEDALQQLRAGASLTVAGSDMAELRRMLAEGRSFVDAQQETK